MTNSSHGISKETFVNADDNTRNNLMFDMLDHIASKQEESIATHHEHKRECDRRFKLIEKGKIKESARSSLFGLIGGFIAGIGKSLWS